MDLRLTAVSFDIKARNHWQRTMSEQSSGTQFLTVCFCLLVEVNVKTNMIGLNDEVVHRTFY